MKKTIIVINVLLLVLVLSSCSRRTNNSSKKTNASSLSSKLPTSVDPNKYYEFEINLPSTELLVDIDNPTVVLDAPELLILGCVLDTYYYFSYETMSGFEYLKIYNNTSSDYNLKNHRIILANPIQGSNFDDNEIKRGDEVLCTGYIFAGLFDEDFIIPSCKTALIWLKPYYWEVGSGSGAITKTFSKRLIHVDSEGKKGAFSQTIEDFREFWRIDSDETLVYELTNMGFIATRVDSNEVMFPVYSPAAGTPYTHLNSTLLRTIEIQKFDDQGGSASITLLNNYKTMSEEERENPPYIYSKQCYNCMEIRDNDEVIDSYTVDNLKKYWDVVCRANFCGKVNQATFEEGQETVSFRSTSNPGIQGWENTMELLFKVPKSGKIMDMIVPLRQKNLYENYLNADEKSLINFVEVGTNYRYIKKKINLLVDPVSNYDSINWKTDEIYSDGRHSSACPTKIKEVCLIRDE